MKKMILSENREKILINPKHFYKCKKLANKDLLINPKHFYKYKKLAK